MIVLDYPQGSPEWHQGRLGIPTASDFSRLVTPTGKPSSQLDGYCNELVAESLIQGQVNQFETYYTQRGKALEDNGRGWFTFITGLEPQEVGFVLRDDRQVGCSPDGLLPDSGLEIKCPKADKHIGYLLLDTVPAEHKAQVQGCMWLCERDHWNFVSYHPELPEKLIVAGRDDKFINTLASQVEKLIEKKMSALEALSHAA